MLETVSDLKALRLIDAHSFCWIFATLLKRDDDGRFTIERKG